MRLRSSLCALANQGLIPLALAGGGSSLTAPLSPPTTTNSEIVKQFLPVEITVEGMKGELFEVSVRASRERR